MRHRDPKSLGTHHEGRWTTTKKGCPRLPAGISQSALCWESARSPGSDPCSAPSQLQEAGSLTGKCRRWARSSLGSQSSSNIWFRVCNNGETQLQMGILVNNYNFGLWLWLVPPRKHHAAPSPSVLWATSSHKRHLKRVEDLGEVCLPGGPRF